MHQQDEQIMEKRVIKSLIIEKQNEILNIELIENSKMILPTNIEKYLIATQLTKLDELIDSLEKEIELEDKKFIYLKQLICYFHLFLLNFHHKT